MAFTLLLSIFLLTIHENQYLIPEIASRYVLQFGESQNLSFQYLVRPAARGPRSPHIAVIQLSQFAISLSISDHHYEVFLKYPEPLIITYSGVIFLSTFSCFSCRIIRSLVQYIISRSSVIDKNKHPRTGYQHCQPPKFERTKPPHQISQDVQGSIYRPN